MTTVCLGAYTLRFFRGGGAYMWMFLNWALGLRALGCELVWLDSAPAERPAQTAAAEAAELARLLKEHGVGERVTVIYNSGEDIPGVEGTLIDNRKPTAFLEYLDLPSLSGTSLELALPLWKNDDPTEDRKLLEDHGWRVRHVLDVSASPDSFRRYVQGSRAEFSCMK